MIPKLLHLFPLPILAAVGLIACAPALAVQDRVLDVSPHLAALPAKFGVAGVSVAVTKDGKLAATGSAGSREVGKSAAIGKEDRFHLGSCTKRMTSFMIYRLIDQGKLKLDTTLGEALKGTPMRDVYRAVTVRELLQFKGGIQPYTLISPTQTPAVFDSNGTAEEQRQRFVAHVLQEEPAATPGTKAVYSNAGFAVLALVASRATGKTWEELMTENVFKPLSMSSAGFGRPYSAATSEQPKGHFKTGSGLEPEPLDYEHPASLSAAGDVSASMSDFAKYAAEELRVAQGKSRLLSKDTSAAMKEVSGFGEGRTLLGGAGAFTAGITLWPSLNCAVVVGVNSGGGEELCRQLSRALESAVVEGKPFALAAPTARQGYGFGLALGPGGSVMVQGVSAGSVASDAGLKEGDEILEMNGKPLASIPDEQRFVALRASALSLKVRRKEQVLDIRMELPRSHD